MNHHEVGILSVVVLAQKPVPVFNGLQNSLYKLTFKLLRSLYLTAEQIRLLGLAFLDEPAQSHALHEYLEALVFQQKHLDDVV